MIVSAKKDTCGLCLFDCRCIYAGAQVKLPQLIRDSMILQRDAKINIWGFASKRRNE